MSLPSRTDDLATIVLFLAALVVPTVATLVGAKEEVSETEFRTLAPPPEWRWDLDVVDTWPSEFESYYDDHFALRTFALERYNWLRLGFFGISPTDSVIVGKGGWLYLAQGTEKFEPLTDAELGRWEIDLDERRDWLATRGTKYLFVAVPDKPDIYPEFMPEVHRRAKQHSRIDLFCKAMSARTTVPVLNLGPPLRAAKTRDEIYFKNDPHWNFLGAHIAYENIMAALAPWYPQLEAIPWKEFGIEKQEIRGGGLARMMGLPLRLTEVTYKADRAQLARCARRIELSPEPVTVRSPFATECADRPLRVVVFRDSYGTALTPYLSESFGHIAYFWERPSLALLKRIVELEQPDLVIEERVSRYLASPVTR
jgi:alginate O-acetyltransferase complex protein AlgJ